MKGEVDRTRWRAEFTELGRAKVRSEVLVGRWPSDKRSFARQWLESQDVQAWQARGGGGARAGGLSKLRVNRRILGLVSGLIFGGFALFRLLRQFKIGF
jgi:hypothetical protein